ncbi:hypothetical protein VU04_01750 [Desulfobulbus sp. TB]|nr:hypothetical protein [Desulfobulbus sp. TB]
MKKIIISTLFFTFLSTSVFSNDFYVKTKTCDSKDAKNDKSGITLRAISTQGNVQSFLLDEEGINNFKRNGMDSFSFVNRQRLGTISHFTVTNPTSDGWCFNWIEVIDTTIKTKYYFQYNGFIDGNSSFPSRVTCYPKTQRCQ